MFDDGLFINDGSDFGILITFKKATQGMINEATKEGYFKCMNRQIPKIQLLIVEDLFKEPIPVILPVGNILPPYKKPIISREEQKELFETE